MENDLFDHFLITRFSYRGADGCSADIDPLDERRLNKRFDLFEAVCLPSVLSQHEKNFTWLLIIDAQLPALFRDRLKQLTGKHDFIHFHAYEPGTRIDTLGWITTRFKPRGDYIITTALDDDDALCTAYVKALHDRVRALRKAEVLPYLKVFGCTNALQWDYCPARQSPLGYLKPWMRRRGSGEAYPLQSGFTAITRQGGLDISAYYFRHSLGDLFLMDDADFERLPAGTRRKIQKTRGALRSAAMESGQDWTRLCAQGAFVEVLPDQPCVLMVNTMSNLQKGRLFEYRDQRRPVIDESSLPGFVVDLGAARRSIPLHGCTASNFLASVLPAYKAAFHVNASRPPVSFAEKLNRATKLTYRCIKGFFDLRK